MSFRSRFELRTNYLVGLFLIKRRSELVYSKEKTLEPGYAFRSRRRNLPQANNRLLSQAREPFAEGRNSSYQVLERPEKAGHVLSSHRLPTGYLEKLS